MEVIKDIIQQNPYTAIGVAIVATFIGGMLFRKLKLFAIILVLIASVILYFTFYFRIIEKENIDNIKRKVKNRLAEDLMEK
ncbi:MAG: hypothetical protein SVZ03_11625 [Spirochaetota bacterium]|nr:hypothetical protein [Spirochaetota bacterium]